MSRSPDRHLDTVWVLPAGGGSAIVAGGREHRLLPSSISQKLSTRARQDNTTLGGFQRTVTISTDRQQHESGNEDTLTRSGPSPSSVGGVRQNCRVGISISSSWRCFTIHAVSLQRSFREPCTVARQSMLRSTPRPGSDPQIGWDVSLPVVLLFSSSSFCSSGFMSQDRASHICPRYQAVMFLLYGI
ncbi:hypothetical protein VTN02DRAFT_2105 [Thermoascus thermophilus]